MSRGDQLGRQWKLLQLLISAVAGKTASELAAQLACNPRTVYRDLEALQLAGFPLYNEYLDGRHVWAVLETFKRQIPVPCSLPELMALYFSRDTLKWLHDTVFYEALESLFQKIVATLPPQSIQFLQQIPQTVSVSAKQHKDYSRYRALIQQVQDAALHRRSLRLSYFTISSRRETKRTVDPYRIWLFNKTFYLIGYCHLRAEVRLFALERIRALTVTEKTFAVPEDFNPDDITATGFGAFSGTPEDVMIRFDHDAAAYIQETLWHATQRTTLREDGALLFEARVAVTQELKLWVLGWGARAEVLAPESLRQAVRAEAQAMLARYTAEKKS